MAAKQWITWRCLFFMEWDVDPTKLALYWIFSCNRSCFIYVVYSKTSCLCNFFNNEWLWTPKISILFMLLFTSSWQQKLNAYPYANTEKIKYPVSHIAGWCTWSACRLHNLPNQKVKKKKNYWSTAFVFPFTVFKWKKSKGCNHSTVQSIPFVLFNSRVFSIRWQGLWIKKYKMDYCP